VQVGVGELTSALTAVCTDLVDLLQADAEGVTKHVTISVRGAATETQALAAARAVSRDNLCKTAFFASDPNWGRIAMAVGNAEADLDPDKLEIVLNGVVVCQDGQAHGDRMAADLSGLEILVEIGLGVGGASGAIRTTDLSHAYVEENSAYSS
jgi:glutamate N-acetyltransferase/amino-acid N-acetyltransferase